MRIVHATDHLRSGGGERLLAALLGGLSRDGRARSYVYIASGRGADPDLVREVRTHADHLEILDTRALYDPALTRAMARAIRRHRADVVHAHPGNANFASRVAARASRVPHLATLHTAPGPLVEETRLRAAVDGWGAWLSSRLVAPSRRLADDYRRAYRLPATRFDVIPNAIETPDVSPQDVAAARAALDSVPGPRVLCVARLQPAKGIADLVDALAALRESVPGASLVVAGDGPDADRLRAHAAERGVGDAVAWLGHRRDVAALLRAADAFCLPSHHEGVPLALLEAMRAGLPCVATSVGGIPEVVDDGRTGLLVAPGSPAALATALERVLADRAYATRLGERARADVAGRHTIEAAARRYADLYEGLADGVRA